MKYVAISFLAVLVIILFGFFYINQTSLPISSDTNLKNFVVNQGDGISTIANRLQANNLIQSKLTFLVLTYKSNLSSHLQAGLFKLSPSMSTADIISKLSTGGNQDYWLKIIDGQRIAQLTYQFDVSQEGYLFPDSYLIPQDYSQKQILAIINDNFNKKLTEAKIDATNTTMSDAEVVTLASVLEREARSLVSKQHVAGILLNRLKINMALQVDASVQYARDTRLKPKEYWTPVSKSDLKISSPYNTYLNPGLPPTPICNPGYDSIYAVLHPIDSDYLYYLTGNDNQMHYAKTLDEHNSNVARYLK